MSQRRGTPRAGLSLRGQPIRLDGTVYPHGIGTRSISEFVIDLVDDCGDTSNDDEVAWAGAMITLANPPGSPPEAFTPSPENPALIAPLLNEARPAILVRVSP